MAFCQPEPQNQQAQWQPQLQHKQTSQQPTPMEHTKTPNYQPQCEFESRIAELKGGS